MEFGRYTRGSSLAAPCAISMELSQSDRLAPLPAVKLMVFFLAGRKVDGLLHAIANLIRSILRSEMLILDRHLLQGDRATQLIALLDLRAILGCGTGHLNGNGLVFGKGAADGNAFTVLEGAGLAFGSGVLQVVGVLGVQRLRRRRSRSRPWRCRRRSCRPEPQACRR